MNEAVKKAVAEVGGLTPLAEKCGVKYQAVQRWLRKGCPAERVLNVERATNGIVTRHELRPDLYPPEEVAA